MTNQYIQKIKLSQSNCCVQACITNKSQIRDLHQSNLILFLFVFGSNLAHRNVHTWWKHVWRRVIDDTYAQHSHPCNHSQDALLCVKQPCSLRDFWKQVYWIGVSASWLLVAAGSQHDRWPLTAGWNHNLLNILHFKVDSSLTCACDKACMTLAGQSMYC